MEEVQRGVEIVKQKANKVKLTLSFKLYIEIQGSLSKL